MWIVAIVFAIVLTILVGWVWVALTVTAKRAGNTKEARLSLFVLLLFKPFGIIIPTSHGVISLSRCRNILA